MIRLLICCCWALLALPAQAQEWHWILLADKDLSLYPDPGAFLSERSLLRRERQQLPVVWRDYPVTPAYLEAIRGTGAEVRYASRWMNAVLARATPEQAEAIGQLPFVRQSDPISRRRGGTRIDCAPAEAPPAPASDFDYGQALQQLDLLDLPQLHQEGFTGQGIGIAVIDGGFRKADLLPALDSLFLSGRLKGTFDFVDKKESVTGPDRYGDDHGTKVLSVMAANLPGYLMGAAPHADYWLLRSEEVASEMPVEEVYWLMAAEYADSAGADVINTSLGYFDFDKNQYDHAYEDFDGDRILISQAADLAAAAGMLVVTSAGNEGTSAWQYLTAPADGDSVLAVGGVNPDRSPWPRSSPGPTADGRTKPDVAAQSIEVYVSDTLGRIVRGTGTSYASPAIAGLAACVWQAFPYLSQRQLFELLRQSGHRAQDPDNRLGHGVPSYARLKPLARALSAPDEPEALAGIRLLPNPAQGEVRVLFPSALQGKPCEVAVFDLQGREVHRTRLTAQSQSRLRLPSGLLEGQYIVRLMTEGGEEIALKLAIRP